LRLDGFRPLALDLILGRSKDYSYLVGGQLDTEPPRHGYVYDLDINYRDSADGRRKLIWTPIRLFADTKSPTYMAVVGEVDWSNPKHVEVMNKTLIDARVTLDRTNPYSPLPPRPTIWDRPQEEVEKILKQRTVPADQNRS